jgi:hypothetical protein
MSLLFYRLTNAHPLRDKDQEGIKRIRQFCIFQTLPFITTFPNVMSMCFALATVYLVLLANLSKMYSQTPT